MTQFSCVKHFDAVNKSPGDAPWNGEPHRCAGPEGRARPIGRATPAHTEEWGTRIWHPSRKPRVLAAVTIPVAAGLVLAGCAAGSPDAGGDNTIIVGTTDKVTTLDPAGSYDNGSLAVQNQVFPYLVNTAYNTTEVEPDLAESAEFTSPTEYTVMLPAGLQVGQRQRPHVVGCQLLLRAQHRDRRPERRLEPALQPRDRTEAVDDTTVVFHLKTGERPGLPAHPDELPGRDRRRGGPSRPTRSPRRRHRRRPTPSAVSTRSPTTTSTTSSSSRRTRSYKGLLGARGNDSVILKYYAESLEPQARASRRATSTSRTAACRPPTWTTCATTTRCRSSTAPAARSATSCSTSTRSRTAPRPPEPTRPRRWPSAQAVADLVDRDAIAEQVYKGTYTPLYSYVPGRLRGRDRVAEGPLRRRRRCSSTRAKAEGDPRGRRRCDPGSR